MVWSVIKQTELSEEKKKKKLFLDYWDDMEKKEKKE